MARWGVGANCICSLDLVGYCTFCESAHLSVQNTWELGVAKGGGEGPLPYRWELRVGHSSWSFPCTVGHPEHVGIELVDSSGRCPCPPPRTTFPLTTQSVPCSFLVFINFGFVLSLAHTPPPLRSDHSFPSPNNSLGILPSELIDHFPPSQSDYHR